MKYRYFASNGGGELFLIPVANKKMLKEYINNPNFREVFDLDD